MKGMIAGLTVIALMMVAYTTVQAGDTPGRYKPICRSTCGGQGVWKTCVKTCN